MTDAMGGSCVHSAGGRVLQEAREDLPADENGNRIKTGGAVITIGDHGLMPLYSE